MLAQYGEVFISLAGKYFLLSFKLRSSGFDTV